MLSKDTIQAVLERADIVRVVEQSGVRLEKRGAGYVACCPFHSERTPSFHVNPARQTWHCFGACQEGGDVLSYVMKREGLTSSMPCGSSPSSTAWTSTRSRRPTPSANAA